MYSFKIRVYNSLSSGLSGEQRVLTKATVPRITGEKPQVNVSGFSVAVDWSKCFILNGPLDNYEVLENGLLIYEGLQNKRDLGTRNIGRYTYLVTAFTLVDGRRLHVEAPLSDLVILSKCSLLFYNLEFTLHVDIFISLVTTCQPLMQRL